MELRELDLNELQRIEGGVAGADDAVIGAVITGGFVGGVIAGVAVGGYFLGKWAGWW